MIYSDERRTSKVHGLHLLREYRSRQLRILHIPQKSSMVLLTHMQKTHRKERNLLTMVDPQKGGTVVPPCDFHPISLKTPVNTGVTEDILSGARPPPRATRVRIYSCDETAGVIQNEFSNPKNP